MENIIVSPQANVLIRRLSGSIGETYRQAVTETKQYLYFLKGLGRSITQAQQLDYLALSLLLEAQRNATMQQERINALERAIDQPRGPSIEVYGRVYSHEEVLELATSVIVLESWSTDISPRPTQNLAGFIVEIEKAERKKSYQKGLEDARKAAAQKDYKDSLWWLWFGLGALLIYVAVEYL